MQVVGIHDRAERHKVYVRLSLQSARQELEKPFAVQGLWFRCVIITGETSLAASRISLRDMPTGMITLAPVFPCRSLMRFAAMRLLQRPNDYCASRYDEQQSRRLVRAGIGV